MNLALPSIRDLCKSPSRIVCIAPSNTELLYALGAQDRIVGVSRFCDFPKEAAAKPKCGGFLNADVKKVLALKPDLVLAQSFLQEDAVKALVHAEVRVLAFSATSLKEVLEDVLLLGRLVEREAKAKEIVEKLHEQIEKLAHQGAELSTRSGRKPRIHMEEWGPSEPYYVAGDWAAEMLRVAGAENAFAHRQLRCPSPQRAVTGSDIAATDPDMIIASWCGFGEKCDLKRIAKRTALKDSRVVKDGWLRCVDDRFVMRPGPRIVEGIRRIQSHVKDWVEAND